MDNIPQNPGGIQDRIDPRDYQWSEIGAASTPFDWNIGFDIEAELRAVLGISDFKIPVKDQGSSGSCGGQAWSYLGEILESLNTKTFEERSAKFIYSQTFVNQPGGGSTGRDNASLVKKGWGLESFTPSYKAGIAPDEDFMRRAVDISEEARAQAKNAKSLSYANVNVDFDSIAQALRDNKGVILLVEGENNGTWLSQAPTPPNNVAWRHWVLVGKARKNEDGKKELWFINSWGKNCGLNGWQVLRENWIGHINQAWTHVYDTNPPENSFSHVFETDMKFGQQNGEVMLLQKALKVDGTFPASVPASGYYGDITRKAVLNFQIKYKVAPLSELYSLNGKSAGPKTRVKLNQLFGN